MTDPEPQPEPLSDAERIEHLTTAWLAERELRVQAEALSETRKHQRDAVVDQLRDATKRAEAAEASCAELREALEVLTPALRGMIAGSPRYAQWSPALAVLDAAIAQPNPGAALLERVRRLEAALDEGAEIGVIRFWAYRDHPDMSDRENRFNCEVHINRYPKWVWPPEYFYGHGPSSAAAMDSALAKARQALEAAR